MLTMSHMLQFGEKKKKSIDVVFTANRPTSGGWLWVYVMVALTILSIHILISDFGYMAAISFEFKAMNTSRHLTTTPLWERVPEEITYSGVDYCYINMKTRYRSMLSLKKKKSFVILCYKKMYMYIMILYRFMIKSIQNIEQRHTAAPTLPARWTRIYT